MKCLACYYWRNESSVHFTESPVIDERRTADREDPPSDGHLSFDPGETPRVVSGNDVTLKCPVSSHPKANVVWRFVDGTELGIGETSGRATVSDDGSLTISDAQPSDSALYDCVVASVGGTDQTDFDLDVVGEQTIERSCLGGNNKCDVSFQLPQK